MRLILGLDGGGTGCRAAVAEAAPGMSPRILGRGTSGPANIRTDPDGALASILAATSAALAGAGLAGEQHSRLSAVLGLAGANVGPWRDLLLARLPFGSVRVENDSVIALEGAIGPGQGAIGILGTGSVWLSRLGGRLRQIGGWGFQLGDQGGGARLGRALLEETLLAHDGMAPATDLTRAMLARFGGPEAIVEFSGQARPAEFGALAPDILAAAAAGDALALRLMEDAAAAAGRAIRALALPEGVPLALLGGLAPHLAPRLPPDIRAGLRPARGDALDGALSLAARLAAGEPHDA